MNASPQGAVGSPLDLCAACGRTSRDGGHCPHCGRPILVCLRLVAVPSDPGERFKAARIAADLGAPALTFGAVNAALAKGDPVARSLPRDRARAVAVGLVEEGFRVDVQPAAAARGAPRGRPSTATWMSVLVAAALFLSAGAIAFVRSRSAPPPPEPQAATPAASPAAPPTAGPTAGPTAAPPAEPTPAATRSVAELFRAAAPALATVTCPGRLGSGFFVTPTRLLTNAHVVCGPTGELAVKLPRGRELVGKLQAQDEWLDYAVVEVFGADVAEPLPLGDSTALEPGQPVLALGSPLGLDATVHEGKVSSLARNLQGVAHVQLNADVNPGNSGGPLLDREGRVLGIVTLSAGGGVGFALPVEYARAAAGLPFEDPAQRERWEAVLARMKAEEDAEAEKLAESLGRAVLLRATTLSGQPGAERLGVAVMKRDAAGTTGVDLEVREGGAVLCEPTGTVTRWTPLRERMTELAEDPATERRVRWMVRRGLARDVSGGVATVPLAGCPRSIPPKAVLMLKGDPHQSVPFPVLALSEARREGAALAERIAAEERAQDEAAWRDAFTRIRTVVTMLVAERRRLREGLDAQRDANGIAEAQRELPRVEAELARAREALEELERQAAARGVPLEWRR